MRKTVLIIVLGILIIGLVFGVVYLVEPEMFSKKQEETFDFSEGQVELVRYPVQKGEIIHTYEVEGQAISESPEIYVEEISLNGITDSNFKLTKNKGDIINQNECFYKYKGKKKSVDFNGRILDILYEQNDNEKSVIIKLLNYDAIDIVANIEMDKIDKIDYKTPVKIVYQGQEYDTEINTIGYEIIDKQLPISISSPVKMYPGTPVKVIFTLDVQDGGLYVPEEAIYQDGDGYFANIEGEYETEPVEVVLGQKFSVEEDGTIFRYVEITSGVKEDDVLVVEQIDNSGLMIKENLENE